MAYFTEPDYSEPYDDVLAIPWNILPTRDTAEVNWCRYEYDWKIARDLGGMSLVCGDMLYDGAEGSSTHDEVETVVAQSIGGASVISTVIPLYIRTRSQIYDIPMIL